MKQDIWILFILLFITQIKSSFWNDIPQRCVYNRTKSFSCLNATFIQPIPLFNDVSYTLQNHQVDIRESNFQISLNNLLLNVAPNIRYLTLIDNKFSSLLFNESSKLYFRFLEILQISDDQGLQWYQLNTSYFPQLIKLDLSYNQFKIDKQFLFNQKSFPRLKSLNLSHNQFETIDNINGNILNHIEILILSYNPLKTILNKIYHFQSLIYLDLSSTLIKQLFSLTLTPRLETFSCRYCPKIDQNEYEKLLLNCSHDLILDFSQTNINSLRSFNPYLTCIKDLTITNQIFNESITTNDLLLNTNLDNFQLISIENLYFIHLNIYDHLKSIDFSNNKDLLEVNLYLISDFIYLQRLKISNTKMKQFSIYFNNTNGKYLHIDTIDLSYNQLETIDFLQYLIYNTLDLSGNQIKILDIQQIHFRHGMYELLSMNFLNLSFNQMEKVSINWNNESPHTIDLSKNKLQAIELHGQTTYLLFLNHNPELSILPTKFNLDLPFLRALYLNSIKFDSLEDLIYLHNLSNLRTLFLNNNYLREEHRTINWNIFYPWHRNLTHLSLKNMSLEKIDSGFYLDDYYHLLTVDFNNNNFECDCTLHPFITWLKKPPPPLPDFYEPLQKVFSINCPVSLFDLQCDDKSMKPTVLIVSFIVGILLTGVLIMLKILYYHRKQTRSEPYHQMCTDNDIIALNETNLVENTENEE